MIRIVPLVLLLLVTSSNAQPKWWEEENSAKMALEERTMADDGSYRSRVNWEDGYLEVTAGATCNVEKAKSKAQCYSMALKTGRHLAMEKLAEIIYGVRIDSDNLFVNEVEEDVKLESSTRGLIKGAREIALEQTEFDDGSVWVEVTMGLLLNGDKGLSSVVVPWMERKSMTSPPRLFSAGTEKPATTPEATGLIVDARGLGLRPAMAPRVVVEGRDEELYGRANIDKSAAIRFGVVGYTDEVEKAKALTERVGDKPMVVKAVAVSGAHGADTVLSAEDAAMVVAADMKASFLKECRVVFIVG